METGDINPVTEIRLEKVVVNMGVGEAGEELEKAKKVMEQITGRKCVYTRAKVKLPTWGIRPGLEIGLKTTLRKKKAEEFLVGALHAVNNKIAKKSFDLRGNFGFGIKEHIELPNIKYDPRLGIRGFDVLVSLERIGYGIRKRKKRQSAVGKKQVIKKEEAMDFIRKKFNADIE